MAYFTDQMGEEFRKAIEDAMLNSEELDDPDASRRSSDGERSGRRSNKNNQSKKRKTKRVRDHSNKRKSFTTEVKRKLR